jgi:hypothetical protein
VPRKPYSHKEATMTEWRYWSDGSYPDDCRWLFRTSGYDRQQAYRPHTDSWEDIPQDNGPNWPRTRGSGPGGRARSSHGRQGQRAAG